ncbi:hypothetical protein PR202_ga24496 [Eleusine coracana subsp. coracana]|uniref:Uncharacterized protein n=1 Tax=Eleusine coracana subsp. coracana TaxID=191504 RepID=A0AAV5D8I7_ELECO|nr:hypothetical protein PR202_ga24496 [Eleusine coracana subsp. coracana]
MEAIVDQPVDEGEVPKTHVEAVAQVLSSTKFFQNVGLEPVASNRSAKAVVTAQVQELEAEVEAEKQGAATLKDKLEDLEQKSEESRVKQVEEIEKLKKDNEEICALVQCLLNMNNA